MKLLFSFFLIILSLFFSCNNTPDHIQKAEPAPTAHTPPKDTIKKKVSKNGEDVKATPKNIKPVFGYRFIISGDFNGDGRREMLTEHFISNLTKKEVNKFYEGLTDYDDLVTLTIKKDPCSFLTPDNKLIDTLQISSGGQLLGLSYLKNEGDLNGDGTDEVSYVVNQADWSNLNTWHLVTCKNKKWKELYSFPIRDWQLPDLPQTFNQYGLMGLEDKIIITNDSINKQIEGRLKNFKGLVKKIRTNKIQVIRLNDEAEEDTLMVDLRRIKRR